MNNITIIEVEESESDIEERVYDFGKHYEVFRVEIFWFYSEHSEMIFETCQN